MMLTSAPVRGKAAKELGLVDEVVPSVAELIPSATKKSLELAKLPSSSLKRSLHLVDKVDPEFGKQVIDFARQKVVRVAKNVPHPNACLNAIEEGIINGPQKGLDREAEEFMNVFRTPTTQALIHFFFATKTTSKVPGVTDSKQVSKPRDIKKAAVIGGGTMGSGIVTALIMNGITCYLKEVNQQFLDAGIARVKDNLQSRVKSGKMSEEQMAKILSLMKPTLDYSGFNEIDIVIEAVIEDIPLKQKVFAELEKVCNPRCILASNTSTINIDLIGEKTNSQDRIIGTHFFSPAHVMPLLEIIRTKKVAPQVIVDTLALAAKLKKTPIVVGNCVGFTANRIFAPYCQAATFLAERGVDIYRIDKNVENFGMPMGPFKMNDLSGLDVFAYVGNIIAKAYPDRVYKSTLGEHMVKAKRFGQKSGSGFYKYEGRKAVPDPEGIAPFLAESRKVAQIQDQPPISVSDSEIVEMVLYPVVNESCRVLEEGMVIRSSDIDVSSVFGYGFPAYRGGVMKYGEQEGFKKIATKMQHWYKTYGHPLFKPSDYLIKLASK
jgi:enoyl-CoA hydratase/3-hydroxyacyl-CoA dehydrogenase